MVENTQQENEQNDDREYLISDQNSDVYSATEADAPKDKWLICHFAFFTIGICQLLPWNFLLNATNYWMLKFEDHHNKNRTISSWFTEYSSRFLHLGHENLHKERTFLQIVFESYLAIASNTPFLLVFCLGFSKTLKQIDDKIKNTILFVAMLVVFVPLTTFVLINTDSFQWTFLYITLVLVFLLNMLSIFIQANFAGLASLLPNSIMHIMVTGQAVSGMFAVIAEIAILLGNWSIVISTFIYFSFACVVIFFTLVVYLLANRTKYFQYYNNLHKTSTLPSSSTEATSTSIKDDYGMVFLKMWPFCLSLTLNFFVTLSLIPAVLVLIVPDNPTSPWNEKFFVPIACFLVFASGDFLGRYLGGYCLLNRNRTKTLLSFAMMRFALIPLLMHCNLSPRQYLDVWFPSQIVFIILNLILGLSNGYIALNVFVNGPLSVPVEKRKISGFFLMLFLGLGLTFGSFASTFLVRIL